MLIKCISNRLNKIENEFLRNKVRSRYSHEDYELDIEISKIYDVYGMSISKDGVEFFICTSDDDRYPITYHEVFFEIIEDTISSNWSYDFKYNYIVPGIWKNTPMFYENLLNGEKKEEDIFENIKKETQRVNSSIFLLKKLISFSLPLDYIEEIYELDWKNKNNINIMFSLKNLIDGVNLYSRNIISKSDFLHQLELIELRKEINFNNEDKKIMEKIIFQLKKE